MNIFSRKPQRLRCSGAFRLIPWTGKEVGVLVDDSRPAGQHCVVFDAEGLSSGEYFIVLKGGGYTQIRKMKLVK